MKLPGKLLLLALAGCNVATAATTVRLPIWACNGNNDRIFRNGLQAGDYVRPSPSHGSGGAAPGQQLRTLSIAGLGNGTQKIHLYIPPNYNPAYATPLVVTLHGTAGSPANADLYAQDVRNTWQTVAATRGFIVAAPVANGASGSWKDGFSAPPNDYTFLAAVMADLRAAYNIDDSRIQLWGFSAGGHVAHDLLVNGAVPALDENHVSAYSVSAGRLFALACLGDSEEQCQERLDTQSRKLPFDLHLGTADPMSGPPYNAVQDPPRFESAGWVLDDTLNYYVFSGGHTYEAGHFVDIWNFFCRFAVSP
jgi:pimeloyl-ACP methyl ester carboxylesterase